MYFMVVGCPIFRGQHTLQYYYERMISKIKQKYGDSEITDLFW